MSSTTQKLSIMAGLLAAAIGTTAEAAFITDPNLLGHQSVVLNWGANAGFATDLDGYAALFDTENPVQQLMVTGFNSPMVTIRLWVDTNGGVPKQVSIWSSTSANSSLTGADLGSTGNTANHFETLLAGGATPVTLGIASFTTGIYAGWPKAGYTDLTVSAPAGTQSLYLNFYDGNANNSNTGGVAIVEVQAFAPIPEPASLALLGLAAVGLLHRRRR